MVRIDRITADQTHDLRRRVLRGGAADADVTYPEDAAAWHAGGFAGDVLIAVATFFPEDCPARPDRRAARLRGMAVDPGFQGRGVGTRLLEAGCEHLRGEGFTVLWAHARDTALDFYTGLGAEVVGDGFVTDATRLPHHVVVFDLG